MGTGLFFFLNNLVKATRLALFCVLFFLCFVPAYCTHDFNHLKPMGDQNQHWLAEISRMNLVHPSCQPPVGSNFQQVLLQAAFKKKKHRRRWRIDWRLSRLMCEVSDLKFQPSRCISRFLGWWGARNSYCSDVFLRKKKRCHMNLYLLKRGKSKNETWACFKLFFFSKIHFIFAW